MFILAQKIGMTQIALDDGKIVPVTLVEAGPATVTQIKTLAKDGYDSIQIGFGFKKKQTKAEAGHLKDLGKSKYLVEFRLDKTDASKPLGELKRGDKLDVSGFNIGDSVKVGGLSKAKGFQGVVKRHGFHGMPASHGHHHVLRHPGSIGQRFPQHTFKGTRMAGRMGGKRVTTRGLKIMVVDKEKNLLAIKGAIPGRRGTLVEIVKL